MNRFVLCGVFAVVSLANGGYAVADVPDRIGGGNVTGRNIERASLQLKALQVLHAGMCRMPVQPGGYGLERKQPRPHLLDERMLLAHEHGIEPLLLFEYYTAWGIPLGDSEQWRRIGKAYAERFAPDSEWLRSQGIRGWGVRCYSAINEPAEDKHNPTRLDPADYAAALEGLADGVHAVGADLRVSPGGWSEVPLRQRAHRYPQALAPLFNAGKLHAICIHRYWDVDHVPMAGRYDWSLQSEFDRVKREAGITADIAFCTDELNVKLRKLTEDDAARDFLTALWDALSVVGDNGQPVTEFVMPWNVFNLTTEDTSYGLCKELDPWTPVARGDVLRMVCELTQGMQLVSADPKRTGVCVLEGAGKKLWVWQNRKAWTNRPHDRFTLTGVPRDALQVEVYGWNGQRDTVDTEGRGQVMIDGLPVGETYLFLARSEQGESP